MKKVLLNFLVLVIIIQTVIYPIDSKTSHFPQDPAVYLSSETTINAFENFVIVSNSTKIASTRSTSNITMIGSPGAQSESQYETYYLLLDSVGNVTDFDVSVDIDYSYTGTMLKSLHLGVGSYYLESGGYNGKPTDEHYNDICQSYLSDAWAGSGGLFGFRCTPNEIPEYQFTSQGTLPTDGIFTLRVIRNDNIVTGFVLQDETVIHSYSWSSGVSRPVNYIGIYGIIVPLYTSTTIGVFSNLSATLVSTDTTLPITPLPSITIQIGLTFNFSLVCSVIIAVSFILAKKRLN